MQKNIVFAEDTAASAEKAEPFSDLKYSYNRYSYFSEDVAFNWADEASVQAVDARSAVVQSAAELSDFLAPCLTEEPIREYLKQYDDGFFAENVLLMHTYIEPTPGTTTGHKLKNASLQDGTLLIQFTSSISSAVCKTYFLDVMQAAVPRKSYQDYPVKWLDEEILEADTVRFTLLDYDTGKKLRQTVDFDSIRLTPMIWDYQDEEKPFRTVTLDMYTNPYSWKQTISDDETFEISLSNSVLPDTYYLPEDYKQVTRQENGSYDVFFRLKRNDGFELAPDATRITIYDKDTGELIPGGLLEHHVWSFGTDIRFREPDISGGWKCTGPIYMLQSNPQIYRTDLARLYRTADIFTFCCEDQPEVTLYDNGSMDLVFRTKLTISGNINGDSVFSVADAVALQRFLLADPAEQEDGHDGHIYNWGNGDYDLDNRLTASDLCLMKAELLRNLYGIGVSGCDFTAQYIRTDITASAYPAAYPQAVMLGSSAELNTYIGEHKDSYNFSGSTVVPGLNDAVKAYTEEWFETHKLLVILLEEGSSSISHEVSAVSRDTVWIKRNVPQIFMTDMAQWHILLELDKDADVSDHPDVTFYTETMQE